jgi:hypothetical protein
LSLCGPRVTCRWRGGVGAGRDHRLPVNQRVQAGHHRHPSDLRLPQSHRDAHRGHGDTGHHIRRDVRPAHRQQPAHHRQHPQPCPQRAPARIWAPSPPLLPHPMAGWPRVLPASQGSQRDSSPASHHWFTRRSLGRLPAHRPGRPHRIRIPIPHGPATGPGPAHHPAQRRTTGPPATDHPAAPARRRTRRRQLPADLA